MKKLIWIFFLLFSINAYSQNNNWEWITLADFPYPTTYNTICQGIDKDGLAIYSFGGVKDTILRSALQKSVYKYDVTDNQWSKVGVIPDTAAKIGHKASFVKHKIYLIGGRYILNDSTFVASNKVHIYNPLTDQFETNGATLPTPIFGQVQVVWRDSLIYTISGWSNGKTIPDVQLYNPSTNQWTSGTSLPDSLSYNCYGGSGYILGDTIYYYGGVQSTTTHQTENILRKGVINPQNPSQINWVIINQSIGQPVYKGVCSGAENTLLLVGGSGDAYPFQLDRYIDSGKAVPNKTLVTFDFNNSTLTSTFNPLNDVMNLGGIANLSGGNWIIVGGVDSQHQLSKKTLLIHNDKFSNIGEALHPPFFVVGTTDEAFIIKTRNIGVIDVFDLQGRLLYSHKKGLADLVIKKSLLQRGIVVFVYRNHISLPVFQKLYNP